MTRIDEIVKTLDMLPHPEGGFYKETYRSIGMIPREAMGGTFSGNRNYATAIYFLITGTNFSAFHRIKQDELWHYYDGSALYVHEITVEGVYKRHIVGMDIHNGAFPQLLIPAGSWFASSVKEDKGYSFVGCTVAPGFDFEDFELAERNKLIKQYPDHIDVITKYTRAEQANY